MPNIKEIALKVLDSKSRFRIGLDAMLAQDFAEALIAEIAKGNEPVAWLMPDGKSTSNKALAEFMKFNPLYELPPTAFQIEQETAEVCAEWVRSGLHDDDPYIIARGLEDGAWKEFKCSK